MWKNEKERELATKEMANKFKEVLERAILEKNTEGMESIILQLERIKQIWEFGQNLKELVQVFKNQDIEPITQTYEKLEKENHSRKEKN